MSRIRHERTDRLEPHPLLERVGTMSSLAGHFTTRAKKAGKNRDEHRERAEELAGDLAALVESVREHGVRDAIQICRRPDDTPRLLGSPEIWWIVDGRNRWLAACQVGVKYIPVVRVRTDDAPEIIASAVSHRRHYTKGATAYLACLMHPEVALDGDKRKKANQFCGPALNAGPVKPSVLSAGGIAQKFSVSLRILEQASELYRLLDGEGKPFRDDAEANIWAGCGLGGVKAGVDFLIANGTESAKPDPKAIAAAAAWQNYRRASKSVGELWSSWDALDATQRETAMSGLKDWFSGAPLVARAALESALKF